MKKIVGVVIALLLFGFSSVYAASLYDIYVPVGVSPTNGYPICMYFQASKYVISGNKLVFTEVKTGTEMKTTKEAIIMIHDQAFIFPCTVYGIQNNDISHTE